MKAPVTETQNGITEAHDYISMVFPTIKVKASLRFKPSLLFEPAQKLNHRVSGVDVLQTGALTTCTLQYPRVLYLSSSNKDMGQLDFL